MKLPIVDQPSGQPTRKMLAVAIAGAAFTVVVWIAKEFYGIPVPGEVQGSVHTAIVVAAGYFVRDRMNV